MSSAVLSRSRETAVPPAKSHTHDMLPTIVVESEAEERGRLKRRRQSSISPKRAPSPSRGHDRNSGSRYREHHRKHHRPSSPSSSVSPPTIMQKKTRRRSDAEPDHTFRGRARKRSLSRGRDRSLILEDEDAVGHGDDGELRTLRKRSMPPSRPRNEQRDDSAEFRRQRSHRDFKQGRRDSKGDGGEDSVGDDVTAKKGQGTIVA